MTMSLSTTSSAAYVWKEDVINQHADEDQTLNELEEGTNGDAGAGG